MNRLRLLAIGAVLLLTLPVTAQQATDHGVPTVEAQMKLFTGKLDLTDDQQAKVKSILVELHDATLKVVEDQSLSADQRMEQIHPLRYEADRKLREVLNEEQQKKLDQLEHESHPELHGDVKGA